MIKKEMIKTTHFGKHGYNTLLLMVLTVLLSACAQDPAERPVKGEPLPLRSTASTPVGPVSMRPAHSKPYTVMPGDTLWGIAEHFLMVPWRWEEIWHRNPQISNPDLIFPGDVIEVFYEAGKPRLQVSRRGRTGKRPTVKVSPKVRVESLSQPIPTLPRDAIEQFLRRSKVLTRSEWTEAPYIVGTTDPRLIFNAPSRIYARGVEFDQPLYQAFRPGREYRDPTSGAALGFDMVYVGEAALEEDGDPAILQLVSTSQESRPGDRLFPVEDDQQIFYFKPHPAPEDTLGQIVAALDDGFLIGQYQTVVLNLGEWDGVEPGHVLAIYNAGRVVGDPVRGGGVLLPDARAGLLMIYKVFDRTSYGLVTKATRNIRPNDWVTEP